MELEKICYYYQINNKGGVSQNVFIIKDSHCTFYYLKLKICIVDKNLKCPIMPNHFLFKRLRHIYITDALTHDNDAE